MNKKLLIIITALSFTSIESSGKLSDTRHFDETREEYQTRKKAAKAVRASQSRRRSSSFSGFSPVRDGLGNTIFGAPKADFTNPESKQHKQAIKDAKAYLRRRSESR
jgi:hypothetical protein